MLEEKRLTFYSGHFFSGKKYKIKFCLTTLKWVFAGINYISYHKL